MRLLLVEVVMLFELFFVPIQLLQNHSLREFARFLDAETDSQILLAPRSRHIDILLKPQLSQSILQSADTEFLRCASQ